MSIVSSRSYDTYDTSRTIYNIGILMMALITLQVIQTAHANILIVKEDQLEYQLPNEVTAICHIHNNCPKIDIKYINSDQAWVNQHINQRVNQLTINNIADILKYPKTPKPNIDNIKNALNDFAKAQLSDLPANSHQNYGLSVIPQYRGHVHSIELFQIDSQLHLGGANGLPYSEWLMFDKQNQKALTLDNLLLPGKKPQFQQLAYNAYRNWVAQMGLDLPTYEQTWKFSLSDNISLTRQGVDILYQPYEIGAYSLGMPVLTIPYNQLVDIIDPQYLPVNQPAIDPNQPQQ